MKLFKNIFNHEKSNFDLKSGERETADSLIRVRKENLYRYKLAFDIIEKEFLSQQTKGIDIFCGNGYGTFLIANYNKSTFIEGIDGSKDAINLAKKHYKIKNNKFIKKLFPLRLKKDYYDYAICIESIEHIEGGKNLLKEIYDSLKKDGVLILSTPNNDILSLEKNPNKFHKKQYSLYEIKVILEDLNFNIKELYGQNIYELDEQEVIKNWLPIEQRNITNNPQSQFIFLYCKK